MEMTVSLTLAHLVNVAFLGGFLGGVVAWFFTSVPGAVAWYMARRRSLKKRIAQG